MDADNLEAKTRHARLWSPFVPLLILFITYLLWTLFQTSQLARERVTLRTVQFNQEKQIQDSKKIRDRLDALMRETQSLANRGNKSALLVVEELRKRGVTINPEMPDPVAPTTPANPMPDSPYK